eukprot:UN19368
MLASNCTPQSAELYITPDKGISSRCFRTSRNRGGIPKFDKKGGQLLRSSRAGAIDRTTIEINATS